MKNILLAGFILFSSAAYSQENSCKLWLGEAYESSKDIKLTAEKHLDISTKVIPNEPGVTNIYQMQDDNGFALIKIWTKPKKMVVGGAMTTVNVISSYKITSLSDKIDLLYKALQDKVTSCTLEASAVNTVFGTSKMFIEKSGGDFSKKNLPMATLTVTAK